MRSNRFWHIVFSCQRAFVLPPCPAEWPATNSLRLAYAPRLSTPHYSVICIFHTLPQTPLFPASTLAISPPPIVAIAECEEGFLAALGMTEREEGQKERCLTPQTPFGMTMFDRRSTVECRRADIARRWRKQKTAILGVPPPPCLLYVGETKGLREFGR